MKKILLLLAFITFGCSDDDLADEVVCTTEARAGLQVTVTDAVTGMALAEGVTVTATDGNYMETLEQPGIFNQFTGAWERAGTYIITVTKNGYQTYVSQPVTVGADVCHVITETVTVTLQPE